MVTMPVICFLSRKYEPTFTAIELSHRFLAFVVSVADLNGIEIEDDLVQYGIRSGRLWELAIPVGRSEQRADDGHARLRCAWRIARKWPMFQPGR